MRGAAALGPQPGRLAAADLVRPGEQAVALRGRAAGDGPDLHGARDGRLATLLDDDAPGSRRYNSSSKNKKKKVK